MDDHAATLDQHDELSSSSMTPNQPSQELKPQSVARPVIKVTRPVAGCDRIVLQRVLARHLRTVHKAGPSLDCEICGESFLRKDSLDRHQHEQHGDDDQTIKCTRCGAFVVRRALNEHRKTRKCSERLAVEIRKSTATIPGNVVLADTNIALLASAAYLVQIRNSGLAEGAQDITVLEARQAALGYLIKISARESQDITMTCASWIFGLADIVDGGSPSAHQAVLKRAEKDLGKRNALFQDILVGAFQRWNCAPASKRLSSSREDENEYNVGYGGNRRQKIDMMALGCGFITSLAGFESCVQQNGRHDTPSIILGHPDPIEDIPWLESYEFLHAAPNCPLWLSWDCCMLPEEDIT